MNAPKQEPWPLWMKLLWQVLAVAVLALQGPTFTRQLAERVTGVDFLQEWIAVKNWQHGRPVYAPLPRTVPLELPETADCEFPITYNAHPPTAVLAAFPIALPLGYYDSVLAWNLLSLALLLFALLVILRELRLRLDPWHWLPACALLLIFNPFRQQMSQGQLNGLLLLLLTLAWRAERRDRPRWAGFWIGLAAALKVFPALFLLYFLARGQWRALLTGVTTLLACLVLTAAVLGPASFVDYATIVVPNLSQFRAAKLNASLPGFWTKLLQGHELEKVRPLAEAPLVRQIGIGVTGIAVLAALWFKTRRGRRNPSNDHVYALWLVGMLLLSPITWDHSLLLLTLPLIWLWKENAGHALGRINVFLFAAIFSLNYQGEWLERMKEGALPTPLGPLEILTCASALFYALVILFTWLLLIPSSLAAQPPEGHAAALEPA
jgi:alpha-1,2-mannosyltransferase